LGKKTKASDHGPKSGLLVILIFLAAGVYAMWPLPLHFRTDLAGTYGDSFQNLFNFWWIAKAFLTGQNPYFTPYMFHPFGVSLLLHTLSPYNSFPGALLSFIIGLPGAYNMMILVHYVLAGYFCHLLVLELIPEDVPKTWTRITAVWAGLVFTLSPFHFFQAREHLQLTAVEGVPLTLLFLVKILKTPNRKNAVLLGLSTALVTFSDMYLLVYTFITFLFFLAGSSLRRPGKDLLKARAKGLLMAGLVYSLVCGPLLIAMAWKYSTTGYVSGHDPAKFSSDLQSLFVPGPGSAWAGWFHGLYGKWKGNPTEQTGYLGYILLFLALLGLLKKRNMPFSKTIASLGLTAVVLSLGPVLHWGGESSDMILPYKWFASAFPLIFSFTGTPARFSFLVNLSLVLLAASGFAWLAQEVSARHGLGFLLLVPVLPAVALVEMAPGPQEIVHIDPPKIFEQWAHDKQNYAVLDTRRWAQMYLGLVTHEKPLVNGHVSRDPLDRLKHLKDVPVLDTLVFGYKCFAPDFEPRVSSTIGRLELSPGDGPLMPGVPAEFFGATIEGRILIKDRGPTRFLFETSDRIKFDFDKVNRLDSGGKRGPSRFETGPLPIEPGWHDFRIETYAGTGKFFFKMHIAQGNDNFMIPGLDRLKTLDGKPGAKLTSGPRVPLISGQDQIRQAFDDLEKHDIKYIIRWPWQNRLLEEHVLKLEKVYEDDITVVYKVPGSLR